MVEDVDGNVFLDFAAGIAVVSTGIATPRGRSHSEGRPPSLIHISCTDFYYPGLVELAERLAAVAPAKKRKKVLFRQLGNRSHRSGHQAGRAYHTRRDKTSLFMAASTGVRSARFRSPRPRPCSRKGFGALLGGVFHMPYPNSYRCPYGNPFALHLRRIGDVLEA